MEYNITCIDTSISSNDGVLEKLNKAQFPVIELAPDCLCDMK